MIGHTKLARTSTILVALCLMAHGACAVITDATTTIRSGKTVVCMLADFHHDAGIATLLRPHDEPESLYQPMLSLTSHEGAERAIEAELIVRHQREALKRALTLNAGKIPTRIFIQDVTAPLPADCSPETTPALCHGHAQWMARCAPIPTDSFLNGLFWSLHAQPQPDYVTLHNADFRAALEGIIPFHEILDKLRTVISLQPEPAEHKHLRTKLVDHLKTLYHPDAWTRWQEALCEVLRRLYCAANQCQEDCSLAAFAKEESDAILRKIGLCMRRISHVATTRPQLAIGLDATDPHAIDTLLRETGSLLINPIEMLCFGLARLPELELIVESVRPPQDHASTLLGITSARHVVQVYDTLHKKFGFAVNPQGRRHLKKGLLQELLRPIVRFKDQESITLEHARADDETSRHRLCWEGW